MTDLKQSLRDFVATANSGKYADENVLISKFPELKGYDIGVLKDFVATSNSGRYQTEDELFSKFPEFAVKKKESVSPSQQKAQPTSLATGGAMEGGPSASSVPLWLQNQEQPKPTVAEETLPFMPAKPKSMSLGSARVPEPGPIFGVENPEFKEPEKIDKTLARLETSLVDTDEEQATEKLKYLFGDLGFTFDQAGVGYDAITVTSPTGKQLDLSWDTFTKGGDEAVLTELKDFISKESKAPSNVDKLQKYYDESNKKFVDQREINETIATLSKKSDDINGFIKSYSVKRDALEKESQLLSDTPENLRDANWNSRYNSFLENADKLESERLSVVEYQNNFEVNKADIDNAVGKYMQTEEKMGWWGGLLLDSFLKGQGRVASSATALFIDGIVNIMPTESLTGDYPARFVDAAKKLGYKVEDYQKLKTSLSEDQIEEINDKVDDELKKQLKYQYGTLETAREANVKTFGSDEVTKQYEAKFKEGFVGGAIAGLAESLPSMLGPSPARVISMYSNITDSVNEEMEKDPELSKISETEKSLVSVPIGIVSAILEEFGLRNVVANKGVLNKLVMRMLGKVGPKTTSRTFAELVRNDVESMVARGLLTVGGAALAEFETGAAQEASEQTIKAIYNEVKGKDVFKNIAQTPYEFVGDMLYAGAQEAVGGFVLGSIPAVSAAYRKQGFEGMSDVDFEKFERIANDDKIESAFVTSLKTQVNSGDISVAEAKETLNDYRKSRGLYKQLPESLNTENKKKAMNLLRERQGIEQEISGKDEALIKTQKSRIQEINGLLEDISKPENNAVQKQTAGQVPVQSGARSGEEVQKGQPQPEPKIVAEEGTAQEEIVIDKPTIAVNSKLEVDSVKSAASDVETGQTFNVDGTVYTGGGLVVSVGNKDITQEELTPELIADFIEENKDKILSNKAKVGIYKFPNSNKVSIDLNIIVPNENREAALEFGRLSGQESLFDLDTFENIKTGADGNNTVKFNNDQLVEIVKNLEIGVVPDVFAQSNFDQALANSAQSLNVVAPGLKMIVGENIDDVQNQIVEALAPLVGERQAVQTAEEFAKGTRGQTIFVDGKPVALVFDKSTADSRTIGHEAWEAMLNDAFGNDQAKFKEFTAGIDYQLRAQGFGDIADALDAFASQRGYEAVKYSEYMAELGGMLVEAGFGKGPLTAQQKTLLQKIGDIINKFAELFTGKKQFLDQATPEDILGFMVTISEKVAKGEDVASFFRKGDKAKAKEGVTSRKQANEAFDGAMKDLGINVGTVNEKTGKAKVTNYDVATALNKYYEKIHKKFAITDFSDNVVNVVSDYAKNEILFALSRFGKSSGKGWYTEDYAKALNTLSKLDKDIAKKTEIKEVATAIIAVASNSTDVYTNLTRVLYGIDKFKSTRKVPTDVGTGKGASAIASGVDRYNNILDKFDNDPVKVAKFLQQIDSISNLKKKLVDTFGVKSYAQAMEDNLATDAEWNDSEVLPMSILVFGPKIGAFYSNLSGLDGTPTIDRWCIRTVYRYRGDMRSKVSEKEMQDFKEVNDIKGVSYSDALVLAQEHSKLFNAILAGRGQYKGMPKDERNITLKPYRKGDQIWKKAQGVVNDISEGIESGVSNKKQYAKDFRSFTKKAFESARDKVMKETGEKLSVSDVQAILWIYEKNLFGHLGVKQREDSTYSSASKTLSDKVASGEIPLDKLKSGDLSILEQADIETDGAMGDIYGSNVGEFKEGIDDAKKRNTTVTSRSQKNVPPVVDEVLTDDGKGNYLFVHYSDENRDVIKPMSGSKSNFTSREEVSAISAVGGVAMYYTKAGQKESGVGNVAHTVLVPKDKVYFYGSTEKGTVSHDPEGFEEEARQRFQEYRNRGNEDRPTKYAFDANNAAAWVTKVAGENGYDMVVTNWGGPKSYRAQTTKALKPEAEYTGFKKPEPVVFEVGDEVFLNGNYSTIVAVDGNVLSYEYQNDYGTFNTGKFPLSQYTSDKITMIEKAKPSVTTRSQKVEVKTIPGYDRMMNEVEGIMDKTMNRGGSYNQASANAINYVQKSAVYEKADDIQREQIIRDFKKIRGEKFKVAPSVAKIMGQIEDIKKVTVKESTALKDQIKLEAKAAKDSAAFVKQLRMDISGRLKSMVGRGMMSARQATAIISRYDKMNILNPVMRDRFVDYMSRVFQSAEYMDKIKEASKLRASIKKNMKSAANQAEIAKLAKDFGDIDPSRVEDIDDYINNATQMLNAVARKTGDPLMRSLVNAADMASYIETEIELQKEQIKNELLDKYKELVDAGVLSSDMTINEIKKVVAAIEENENEAVAKEEKARAAVKEMMAEVSPLILQIVKTGEDPFTGEPITLTQDEKRSLVALAKMDTDNLSLSSAIQVLEYANNFVANGITSGIDGMVSLYQGDLNAGDLVDDGIKSIPLSKYFSKAVGKVWGEGFATLPMLNKLLWGNTRRAITVSEKAGINGVSNGKAKALKMVDTAVKQYVKQFSKVKDFLASENVVERGVFAFMSRNVIGDEFQAQDEFNRRKSLIEETIQALTDVDNNTDAEIKKGEVIQKVYDKVLKDAKNIDDVKKNVSQINQDAVNWWINKWSENFDRLDEVSRNVYNTQLSRDIDFTPDRFQLKEAPTATEEDFDSGFFGNFENVDTSKSGSLRKNNRIANLPKDKNGVKTRIVNLDFDVNNVNAFTNAMVDVETASSVMQMKGFVTSKNFSKLFSNKEDKNLYKKRLIKYVNRAKGGSYVDQNELTKINRVINTIASFGVAKALFSVSQPFKQFFPPMMNTFVQTGRFDLNKLLYGGGMSFIDSSGYPIANRGVASQGELKSINRQLVEAEKNLAMRGLDGVAEFSNKALEITLKNPDIFAARASWLSFYLSKLKKDGVNISAIDLRNHEINKKAADYAQAMVDSQQNISDTDMQGEIFASKQPATVFLRRAILPLMTFTLNQKTRIWSDIRTITNNVSSIEDKSEAGRSLGGAVIELVAFQGIALAFKELYNVVAAAIMGEDEDEEQKKIRKMRQAQSTAQAFMKDFFLPPIPGMDIAASKGINYLLDETGLSDELPYKWYGIEDEEQKFRLYDKMNQGYLDMLGTQGIAAEKALELIEYYDAAIDGEFTKEYNGNKVKKALMEEDLDIARMNAVIMTAYYGGLLPSDMANIVNIMNKKIQKRAEQVDED